MTDRNDTKDGFTRKVIRVWRWIMSIVVLGASVHISAEIASAQSAEELVKQSIASLLLTAEAQVDLRTDRKQIDLIFALQLDMVDELRQIVESKKLGAVRNGRREALTSEQLRDEVRRVDDVSVKILEAVLSSRQYKRLEELRVQQEGLHAFERKEFRTRLALTPEQSAEVAKVFQSETNKTNSERSTEISQLLTPEQRSKWKAMRGRTFNFPRGRRPRRD